MYVVLAYYYFCPSPEMIQNPHELIKQHKTFFEGKDAKGRIYINEQGINGQMSIEESQAESFIQWMHGFEQFKNLEFKVHLYPEHAFAKMAVKYRKQLVAIDAPVDLRLAGEHLSSSQWDAMLEEKDQDTILVDVRNDYEWKVGHFEGAILPQLETFRDFNVYIDQLKKLYDAKKTKVMMYCTGGIRCEIYSALMKEKGFDAVYQLQGGVIKYGLEHGTKHWRGKLFVFDDRMVVPISKDNEEVISKCSFCDTASDVYYNCANMDCNALFLSCPCCVESKKGCCSEGCMHEPRVRVFDVHQTPRPFRKLPFQEKEALKTCAAST